MNWTQEELKILEDTFPHKGSIGVQNSGVQKTEYYIRKKASELGLKYDKEKNSTNWTQNEIEIVKRLYLTNGAKGVKAAGVDRTEKAIRQRANELGLTKNSFWTQEELNVLTSVYPTSGSLGVQKAGVDRDLASIQMKAYNLGISSSSKWSKEEEEILRTTYPYKGIKGVLEQGIDRTEQAIRTKVRDMGLVRVYDSVPVQKQKETTKVRKRTVVTPEFLYYLRLNKHMTVKSLAEHVNLSSTTLQRILKDNNIILDGQNRNKNLTEEQKKYILQNVGKPCSKIAEELGINDHQIYHFLKLKDVNPSANRVDREARYDYIRKNRHKSAELIAEKLGMSPSRVTEYASIIGVKLKDKNFYPIPSVLTLDKMTSEASRYIEEHQHLLTLTELCYNLKIHYFVVVEFIKNNNITLTNGYGLIRPQLMKRLLTWGGNPDKLAKEIGTLKVDVIESILASNGVKLLEHSVDLTEEMKKFLVTNESKSVEDLAKELGVKPKTVYTFLKEYRKERKRKDGDITILRKKYIQNNRHKSAELIAEELDISTRLVADVSNYFKIKLNDETFYPLPSDIQFNKVTPSAGRYIIEHRHLTLTQLFFRLKIDYFAILEFVIRTNTRLIKGYGHIKPESAKYILNNRDKTITYLLNNGGSKNRESVKQFLSIYIEMLLPRHRTIKGKQIILDTQRVKM